MPNNINNDNDFQDEQITIYHKIYCKLDLLTSGLDKFLKNKKYLKIQSQGFMDLIIEKIGNNEISLAHYYKQNGDLVPDPDMTVKINIHDKTAEVLSYQDCFKYSQVYLDDGKINKKLKRDLNNYFIKWLAILKQQGFYK